jgi:tetratricopeptide (TPR) repeat protein
LIFQRYANAALVRLDETTQRIDRKTDALPRIAEDMAAAREDTAALRKMVEGFLNAAVQEGRVTEQQLEARDAEIARLAEELRKLQEQLVARASEPTEVKLSNLLAFGDLAGAVRLKTEQVETRRSEAEKLPRDLFELGTIHELRFDWPKALVAYREAWRLHRDPEYGFRYAYNAQRQNQFLEAIGVYEVLLKTYTNLPDVATTLNNLAVLYRASQRKKEAEAAYQEALSIRRELTRANPEACLPDVATTLNNLAVLYSATQRMKEAEAAYQEALSTYRELAQANPEAYLPDVAGTLNNLAVLYSDTQRMKEAEAACREAEGILEPLWFVNPELHGDQMARILLMRALLCESLGESGTNACALARQALAAACNPDLKKPYGN